VKINLRVLAWMRRLKRNLLALWFASRHPDTPLIAKILAVLVVGYAFSPIDLIPDFIPIIGYFDEFVLLPGAVFVIFKLIPQPVLDACHAQADAFLHEHKHKPQSYVAAGVIVLLWVGLAWWLWSTFGDAIAVWFEGVME